MIRQMDIQAINKVIHANMEEEKIIWSFVQKYGFRGLMRSIEAGLPEFGLSARTMAALRLTNYILENSPNALAALSKLIEIPYDQVKQKVTSGANMNEVLDHPEQLDLDSRQLYSFRLLHNVYKSYQWDKSLEVNQLHEDPDYECDR